MYAENAYVAATLLEIAALLEIQSDNPHRIQAYRTAAQTVRGMPSDYVAAVLAGNAPRARGIGDDLRGKIAAIASSGTCGVLDDLRRVVPPACLLLLRVPGLGPKSVRRLQERLGVRSIRELQRACEANRVRELPGFGEKSEAKILEAITAGRSKRSRVTRAAATRHVVALLRSLRRCKAALNVVAAGSYRRRRGTVGDIDLLVATRSPKTVLDAFARYRQMEKILSRGEVRSTGLVDGDLQVDLRVVPPESFGAALVYFTGSKAHNIELRRVARKLGLKLNEYGVFREGKRIAGRTEQSVYRAIGVPWMSPRQREGSIVLPSNRSAEN